MIDRNPEPSTGSHSPRASRQRLPVSRASANRNSAPEPIPIARSVQGGISFSAVRTAGQFSPQHNATSRIASGSSPRLGMSPAPSRQPASVSTLSSSTCAPAAQSSGLVYSASLWLMPLAEGTKIIPAGSTRAMLQASCPAPDTIRRPG